MGNKSHFFRQSSGGGGLFPLQLTPVVYINASQGVNLDSFGRVDTVDDLSGNGYNFSGVNSPELEINGINNLPSIRLNGSNYLSNEDTLTEISDLSQRFIWCVFKITDANSGTSYHNIFINDTTSYNSVGNNYIHFYNSNNSNSFYNGYAGNVPFDSTISETQLTPKFVIIDKTLTQVEYTLNGVSNTNTYNLGYTASNKNIYLGSWNSRNAKMLLSEYGILNYTPTPQQIQDLKDYFQNTYNI